LYSIYFQFFVRGSQGLLPSLVAPQVSRRLSTSVLEENSVSLLWHSNGPKQGDQRDAPALPVPQSSYKCTGDPNDAAYFVHASIMRTTTNGIFANALQSIAASAAFAGCRSHHKRDASQHHVR
jgi:hypothetical protein